MYFCFYHINLKSKATSPHVYFALTSQIGDYFMPPFFPHLPPLIKKIKKQEEEKEGWSVRKISKSGWWSHTSFVSIWTPSLLQIGSCQHQLGLFCLLGVSTPWGRSKRMSTFLLLSEEIWIQEPVSNVVMLQFTAGKKKKDQHTPPSIYLILKIIFHWVWLASTRAVTHTGIQTKAALALGQWAGAGWSMSILSSE